MRALLPLLLLCACKGDPGTSCDQPALWYPDTDQDSVGETTGTYFGCTPPEGWTKALPGTTDTGLPADPGGTGLTPTTPSR